MTEDQLQFIDYRKPMLEMGDYTFTTSHQYKDPGSTNPPSIKEEKLDIRVSGERTVINADDIYAQYPPRGETGEYSDTIPHIALKKGALPWSRSAYSDANNEAYEPWLFLMLINQADIDHNVASAPVSGEINDFKSPPGGVYFPTFQALEIEKDPNLSDQEKVMSYVDVDVNLFNDLIGKQKLALKKLAHIRRRFIPEPYPEGDPVTITDDAIMLLNKGDTSVLEYVKIKSSSSKILTIKDGQSWSVSTSENDYILELHRLDDKNIITRFKLLRENSVLIANRFAQTDNANYPQGMRHYALLVSLENYLNDTVLSRIASGSFQKVRLLVTHHWWFSCKDNPINFSARCQQLDVDSLRLNVDKIAKADSFSKRLNAGLTGIEHKFRLGDHSVSWYRGPLVPCDVGDADAIHLSESQRGLVDDQYIATDADKLLVYLKEDGMFDISYACAYELGRFLSMSKPRFMQALMNYKRNVERYVRLTEDDEYRRKSAIAAGITIRQLPYTKLNEKNLTVDYSVIENGLLDLANLKNIPAWYLLADNQLLPRRTLRVFNIDPKWIQSLWLGALSLGGRAKSTYELFTGMHNTLKGKISKHGMLLRSDVVWSYPELDAKNPVNDEACNEKYFPFEQRLDHDVKLYLCQQPFKQVSLALPLESLHYGVDMSNLSEKNVVQGTTIIGTMAMPFCDESRRIIDVDQLCKDFYSTLKNSPAVSQSYIETSLSNLTSISPSQLGRYLIEGEPKAIYKLGEVV